MDKSFWMDNFLRILAVSIALLGMIVIIPYCWASQLADPYEIIENSDRVHNSDTITFTVPMYLSDSNETDYHSIFTISKGITREQYVDAVLDESIPHECLTDRYGPVVRGCNNLPDSTMANILGCLEYCEDICGREYTDFQKVMFINRIVNSGIRYAYDDDMYGVRDYTASPLETMYLGYGDCEDTSLLFISILRNMGFDCALIILDGHIMGGVKVDGYGWKVEGYTAFDCVYNPFCTDDTLTYLGGEKDVIRVCTVDTEPYDGIYTSFISYCLWMDRHILP